MSLEKIKVLRVWFQDVEAREYIVEKKKGVYYLLGERPAYLKEGKPYKFSKCRHTTLLFPKGKKSLASLVKEDNLDVIVKDYVFGTKKSNLGAYRSVTTITIDRKFIQKV